MIVLPAAAIMPHVVSSAVSPNSIVFPSTYSIYTPVVSSVPVSIPVSIALSIPFYIFVLRLFLLFMSRSVYAVSGARGGIWRYRSNRNSTDSNRGCAAEIAAGSRNTREMFLTLYTAIRVLLDIIDLTLSVLVKTIRLLLVDMLIVRWLFTVLLLNKTKYD